MRVRRVEFADRVDREGQSAVLVGDHVVRLSLLATLVVDGCADWVELEVLTTELVSAFGTPPAGDAESVTLAVVTELVSHGVLEIG